MPIDTIAFEGVRYPAFQAHGNAAQFIRPVAQQVCRGTGIDVGCGCMEWCLPGAIPIDPGVGVTTDGTVYQATDFPYRNLDYVFSSHCLEHLDDWVAALRYWYEALAIGGVLLLYLPHYSQTYWRPWNNRKHRHVLEPQVVQECVRHLGFHKVFVSGVDLNNSWSLLAEKKTPNNPVTT